MSRSSIDRSADVPARPLIVSSSLPQPRRIVQIEAYSDRCHLFNPQKE